MTFSIAQSRYNTSPSDSRSLDNEETILGHLILEKEYGLYDALTYLTSYARQETKSWDNTEAVSSAGFWVGMIAGGATFMAVGAGPIGMAIGCIVAAIGGGGSWVLKDTAERVGQLRRTEYELHRNHPWIRDRLWSLSEGGATTAEIVAIYDQMIFKMCSEGIPIDGTAIAGSMGITAPSFEQSPALDSVDQYEPPVMMGNAAIAPTELQEPIAYTVAVAPSMPAFKESTTIARVAEPNYLARIWQIIDRNNNFFVGGQPGSGKGVMVSNLIRRKLDQYPGSIAVWIDPKGSPREDGNFKDPRITRLKIAGVGMSRSEYAIEVAEMIETARSFVHECEIEKGKRVWIVFDEIMNMKQKLDKTQFGQVQDLLVDCVSMGDDQGLHTIALTQSFNAGDTVGSDELLKNLALIGCFKEDDYPRVKKLVQFGKTNHESFSIEEFTRLVRKSPRKRVICIGGTFIPAPEMPLLSGWDRDKGATVTAQPMVARSVHPDDDWDGIPEVESDGPDSEQWDLIERFAQETGQGYFNNPNFDLWMKKQTKETTWIAEGRSEESFDDSWELLMSAVATQAMMSTGLQQKIILTAAKNAQILNQTGKESEAKALLQAQLK